MLPWVTFKKVVWIEAAPKVDWVHVPVSKMAVQPETFEINWLLVFGGIYAVGILIFLFRFALDFGNLTKVLRHKKVLQQADFKFVDVNENVSPFSYFNYIVYNSSLYSEAELANILEHEKVHCEQNHTADVLIARLFCIVFWFNPFVWLYKKAILQNLEFIADSEAIKNTSDKTAYQFTLLKVTTHENCVEITNHFFQSLIKKRIVMLNKNQSKKWNSWKYFLIVPALAAFMFYFQVKVIAQEKQVQIARNPVSDESLTVVVDKNTTDEELKAETKRAKEIGINLKFSKIKRNLSGEIVAIKAEYKDKKSDKKGVYQLSGDEPIKPLRFFKNDNGAIGFGNPGGIHIFKNRDAVAVADVEAPEPPDAPDMEAPEAPEEPDFNEHSVTVNSGKNGKIVISVNGEDIDIDRDAVLADVDKAFAGLDDIDIRIDSKELNKITRDALRQARDEMRKARPEILKARMELRKSRPEIERAQREIELSKPELEQAKREIEQAREEIKQAKVEIEQQRAEIEKSKSKK
ncbi:antirepressor [Flavobacterium noncentrifugens]|nr:antirepressor [Flavobacterium noncentrifugens]